MGVRIVICVDLESDDAAVAYKELWDCMAASGLDWESSDEWYAGDGDEILLVDQQAAREKAVMGANNG